MAKHVTQRRDTIVVGTFRTAAAERGSRVIAVLLTGIQQEAPSGEIPEDIAIESQITVPGRSKVSMVEALDRIGRPMPLSCPECGGPYWQVGEGGAAVFRCHTGHAHTARSLLESQSDEIEESLWVAVRALTERATVLDRLARASDARGPSFGDSIRERAREAQTHSDQARQFLLSLRAVRPDDEAAQDVNLPSLASRQLP